jgi:hypothetical protein
MIFVVEIQSSDSFQSSVPFNAYLARAHCSSTAGASRNSGPDRRRHAPRLSSRTLVFFDHLVTSIHPTPISSSSLLLLFSRTRIFSIHHQLHAPATTARRLPYLFALFSLNPATALFYQPLPTYPGTL